jgi:hypothetical protein
MLLTRRGYGVLLFAHGAHPEGALSAHYLQTPGAAYSHRWGLLGRLEATGCPSINEVQYDFGSSQFRAAPLLLDGVSTRYAPPSFGACLPIMSRPRSLLDSWRVLQVGPPHSNHRPSVEEVVRRAGKTEFPDGAE